MLLKSIYFHKYKRHKIISKKTLKAFNSEWCAIDGETEWQRHLEHYVLNANKFSSPFSLSFYLETCSK